MNPEDPIHITRRNLPHWRLAGATYFITFRVKAGELTQAERDIVFQHVRSGADRFYTLLCIVVMPDHVHLLLRPERGFDLARILRGIKGVSAKQVNAQRGWHGAIWQDESWDRIVRDDAELREKLQYMLENPSKKDLITDGIDWPWFYVNANE